MQLLHPGVAMKVFRLPYVTQQSLHQHNVQVQGREWGDSPQQWSLSGSDETMLFQAAPRQWLSMVVSGKAKERQWEYWGLVILYPSRTSKELSFLDSFLQVSKRWPDLLIFMSWGLPPWPILLLSSSIFYICYCSAVFCTPNYIWASAPSKIQVTHICLQLYIWAPANLD